MKSQSYLVHPPKSVRSMHKTVNRRNHSCLNVFEIQWRALAHFLLLHVNDGILLQAAEPAPSLAAPPLRALALKMGQVEKRRRVQILFGLGL